MVEEDTAVPETPIIYNALVDNIKKRNRSAYIGSYRATKYRKQTEAKKVDPKKTLFNFGITVSKAPSVEEQVTFKKIPSKAKELMLIENSYDDIT
jgi:hypothetical protein